MNGLRLSRLVGSIVCLGVLWAPAITTAGQGAQFSSVYTDLKKECQPAFKLKKGQELQGDDMPLRCKGYGGYEIRIDYSAASSHLRVQPVGDKSDEAINLAAQPINYDQDHKIEWRLANGKPFAVILRVDKSKSEQPEEMWWPKNKSGQSLIVKGLKQYEQIDFEVDAKTPNANFKAQEMAEGAYFTGKRR
jgi:hypothetical protein